MTNKKKKKRRLRRRRFLQLAVLIAVIAALITLLSRCGINRISQSTEEETASSETEETDDEIVIVLDPGHGFDDVGNDKGYLTEYESYYTILYASELKEKLEAMGATVYLTHDGESYPSEEYLTAKIAEYGITFSSTDVAATADDNLFNKYERVMYASILNYEDEVDFFLSIHFNSYETGDVCGAAVYYYENCPNTYVASKFASIVMNEIGYASNYSGIYSCDYDEAYAVTKYGDYPSALIELAFMTNASDAANIASETWRDEITTLLAQAIMSALGAD